MTVLDRKNKPQDVAKRERGEAYTGVNDLDEEEMEISDSPSLDDFEAVAEGDDIAPGDRRRDPLRH